MGRLTEVQTNDESSFLPVSAESTEVSRIQEEFAQEQRVPAIIAYSADRTLTDEQLAAIGEHVAVIQDHRDLRRRGSARWWAPKTTLSPSSSSRCARTRPGTRSKTVELLAEQPIDGWTLRGRPRRAVADLVAAFGDRQHPAVRGARHSFIILITVYRSPDPDRSSSPRCLLWCFCGARLRRCGRGVGAAQRAEPRHPVHPGRRAHDWRCCWSPATGKPCRNPAR